jgi:hypothetical protein
VRGEMPEAGRDRVQTCVAGAGTTVRRCPAAAVPVDRLAAPTGFSSGDADATGMVSGRLEPATQPLRGRVSWDGSGERSGCRLSAASASRG